MIPFTSDEEIAEIASGLLDKTLPKERWTHGAHFASTLWLLSRYTPRETLHILQSAIPQFNEAKGGKNTDSSGYHETITQASVRAAHAFRLERPAEPIFVTCNALMDSPFGRSSWLLTYWKQETLFSLRARKEWIDPDLQPLPF